MKCQQMTTLQFADREAGRKMVTYQLGATSSGHERYRREMFSRVESVEHEHNAE